MPIRFKIILEGSQPLYLKDMVDLTDFLENCEPNDVFKLELCEMSDEEFAALPEFEGF